MVCMEHLTEAEEHVAELVWEHGTLSSSELVSLCAESQGWKKSTTYTILKRLENKEILKNNKGEVVPLVSREEYQSEQGCRFIDDSFGGSLPGFLTAFTRKRRLSPAEIREIQNIIETFEEDV